MIGAITMICMDARKEGRQVGDPSRLDMADAAMGLVVGIVTGISSVVGWFSRKLGKVHDRIDRLHAVHADHATNIAVLQANGQANVERLDRIEDGLTSINEKQDRQMQILMELHGRGTNSRGH